MVSHPVQSLAAGKGIGLIMPLCCDFGTETKDGFSRYLSQAGIPPGEVEILVQRPSTDRVSLLNSVRKLLAYDTKVLVVFGGTAALEAAQESRDVPVVFVGAYDPVNEGLVQKLDKPGKNMTGTYCRTSMAFLVENIQETLALQNLGVIFHSDSLDSRAQMVEINDLAAKKSISTTLADLKGSSLESVVKNVQPSQFVYLAAGCYPDFLGATDLSTLAKPIATQCQSTQDSQVVVFSLFADGEESLAEAARLTSRILKGEKPGQIPVSGVKKINFVVNLAAAQRMGLKIPFTVLSRATKIIK